MPALLCHGLYDPLLPLALAERTRDALIDSGLSVAFHTYPIAHTVCDAEITTLSAFLTQCYGDA
jgi:phospholipase/carboxylesterase